MAKILFHPSLEGAQHGGKSLEQFLAFSKKSGGVGAQPSSYHLETDDGLMSGREIRDTFAKHEILLDGISAHCIFWAHTTAWTGSKTVRPFLPKNIWQESPDKIEAWCEDYILRLLELCAELNVKIVPMFWGVSQGFELATGYPFGFFKGPDYDLIQEAADRFIQKTAKIRAKANELGIYLAHEIHPNSAAICAEEFLDLVNICDGDKCLTVTADPSHCWEGETPETRFRMVSDRVVSAAVKNFFIRPGVPLRKANGDWKKRAMQFVDLPSGDMNLVRFTELLIDIGYPQRYCKIMGTNTAPLVTEAESAVRDLDDTAANAIAYARDRLCFPIAEVSFEEGMGA